MKRLLLISLVANAILFGKEFFFRLPGLGLLRVTRLRSHLSFPPSPHPGFHEGNPAWGKHPIAPV